MDAGQRGGMSLPETYRPERERATFQWTPDNEDTAMARGRFRPTIISWQDLDAEGLPSFPDQQFLAEGDSWFTISGIPAYNLLFELRFRKQTRIVNCATPGDTIKHVAQITKNRSLREALSRSGLRWDAILLSGGGNDLIDAADDILLGQDARDESNIRGPADYCSAERLQDLIADVQDGYRKIAALRDADNGSARGAPILTHTYDYATPRNAPARFLIGSLGPWLYTALVACVVPKAHWVAVADYLINALAEGILALQKGPQPIANFHVVDTRGTLKRAQLDHPGSSNDWQNEIHPNGGGYEKLAKLVEPTLEGVAAGTS
jgi:hypothetical protein